MKEINSTVLIIIILFAFWNLSTFFLMGWDKHKSIKGYYRVKESTLILSAFLMGGIGSLVGSLFFRHKSKKMKFKVLLPVALLCNIGVIILIF